MVHPLACTMVSGTPRIFAAVMNQIAIQQIASELTLAGTDPKVRERIERLEKLRRITPDRELPPMRFLFRLFGRPCFPRGELVAITGKAKSGKTFVTSMLMAVGSLTPDPSPKGEGSICQLPLKRIHEEPLRMLWIDTEQSEESTQDILKNRIIPMILSPSRPADSPLPGGEGSGFDVFNVRGEPWQERMPLVEAAIGQYKPDLVIVDGIRDLINDINDGVLAQEVIEQLMHLASAGGCCIVCVLHQNKASEDRNLRGWIGTELMNKAFEVYACEKQMPHRIFSLEQTHTRKYDIPDVLYYTVDEKGLPVATGRPADEGQNAGNSRSKLPSLNDEYIVHETEGGWHFDVQRLFSDILQGKSEIGHPEMQLRLMELTNIKSYQRAAEVIREAIAQNVIEKGEDAQRHVVYRPAPF